MSLLSNGITAEVTREVIPPYRLSSNLLAVAFSALLPPSAATAARREGAD